VDGKGKIKGKTKGQNLRDRKKKKIDDAPKFEYVTVWYPDAAVEISRIVRSMSDGPLFFQGRKRLFAVWQRHGLPSLGVTLHDLRRASGFYLGRVIEVPVTLIQDHLRHENINTALLYLRRPREEMVDVTDQDFDDVI
jgi:integrase